MRPKDTLNPTPHTPTPWRRAGGMVDGYAIVADCAVIAPGPISSPNAEYIVRAVNAHDALVRSIAAVLDELAVMGFDTPQGVQSCADVVEMLSVRLPAVREALALAGGEG